jgi:hypothetical protein
VRRAIVVAVTLLAAPARAGELDLSGLLGGGYSRGDTWGTTGDHTGGHTWDGEATLGLTGSPFRPGLLDFLLAGDYRDQRTVYDRDGSRTRVIGGRAGLSLFGGSFLPLGFTASRTWTDFFSDTGAQRTGGNVITTLGATAVLQPRRYPALRATLGRNQMESRLPGGETSEAGSTRLSVGLAQTLGNHDYALEYGTGWDQGTFAQNNHRSHNVLVRYSGGRPEGVQVHLTERYFLREPTVAHRANPRVDDNNLTSAVQWRVGREGQASFDYGYRHLVVGEAGDGLEQLSHRVGQRIFAPASKDLSFRGTLELGHGLARRGEIERRSASQAAGASLSFRRAGKRVSFFANAGGSFGLVAPGRATSRPPTRPAAASGSRPRGRGARCTSATRRRTAAAASTSPAGPCSSGSSSAPTPRWPAPTCAATCRWSPPAARTSSLANPARARRP